LTPQKKDKIKTAELWVMANGTPVQAKIAVGKRTSFVVQLTKLKRNTPVENKIFEIATPEQKNRAGKRPFAFRPIGTTARNIIKCRPGRTLI
jgi:hypothetical protein